MAAASLNKMAVPTGGANTTSALLQPKVQYKFRMKFIQFGSGDSLSLTRQVIDCNRPQVTFETVTLPIYNSTVYVAGRHTWNELTVNLRDDINNEISKEIGRQLQKQLDFVEQASARAGSDYKFTTYIEILDGNNGTAGPQVLEAFTCYGCFIQAANYQTLNYGTNDPVQISLTIRYDNALQSTVGGGSTYTGVGSGTIANSEKVTATGAG